MLKAVSFTKNVLDSIRSKSLSDLSNDVHIREGMNWLMRAQRMTNDGGVSAGFHMYHGWLPSYPETTGYIIETFHHYAASTTDPSYQMCAEKMADWLCSIQNNDGSMPDMYFRKKMIFDTGQAIFGFVESFKASKNKKYKDAAIRAADWIVGLQEDDGTWVRHALDEIPHAYYSRVAWSLLKAYGIRSDERYINSCIKNIEWCLRQQLDNGWFENSSFNLKNNHRPFTHTIAYTIRGILEAGIYLNNSSYIDSAQRALDNLAQTISSSGFVCGTYDRNWNGDHKFTCLTGNAQLSISFLKLAKLTKTRKYFEVGVLINRYVKSKQNISTNNLDIRGAIGGSYPIWGRYIHFNYPNWATKFFVDVLLLEKEIIENKKEFL